MFFLRSYRIYSQVNDRDLGEQQQQLCKDSRIRRGEAAHHHRPSEPRCGRGPRVCVVRLASTQGGSEATTTLPRLGEQPETEKRRIRQENGGVGF